MLKDCPDCPDNIRCQPAKANTEQELTPLSGLQLRSPKEKVDRVTAGAVACTL